MWHERKVGMFRVPYERPLMPKKKIPEQTVAHEDEHGFPPGIHRSTILVLFVRSLSSCLRR